ncbi:hypothetical protein OAM01_02855 [bacterium]|nr:hypothetical protein [bacterium]
MMDLADKIVICVFSVGLIFWGLYKWFFIRHISGLERQLNQRLAFLTHVEGVEQTLTGKTPEEKQDLLVMLNYENTFWCNKILHQNSMLTAILGWIAFLWFLKEILHPLLKYYF